MKQTLFSATLVTALSLGLSTQAYAAQWQVTVTNLTHGSHFTDLLFTAHDNSSHIFQVGMPAGQELRAMAECGMLTDLTAALPTGATSDTNMGLLAPGTESGMISLDTMNTSNTRLSIVAMILPSNDGFVGLDALDVPTAQGTYTYYLNAYDAGTEANDEIIDGSVCTPGMAGLPAAPSGSAGTGGSGVTDMEFNDKIHIHRGILGDTDSSGGLSDLNSTVHRWQNPVAKVTVTVTP